jgi:hypothetical protein
LSSVVIPSSVIIIEDYAFYECAKLTGVTLSRETNVGYGAFDKGVQIRYVD